VTSLLYLGIILFIYKAIGCLKKKVGYCTLILKLKLVQTSLTVLYVWIMLKFLEGRF